jgi:hypothetical protein
MPKLMDLSPDFKESIPSSSCPTRPNGQSRLDLFLLVIANSPRSPLALPAAPSTQRWSPNFDRLYCGLQHAALRRGCDCLIQIIQRNPVLGVWLSVLFIPCKTSSIIGRLKAGKDLSWQAVSTRSHCQIHPLLAAARLAQMELHLSKLSSQARCLAHC